MKLTKKLVALLLTVAMLSSCVVMAAAASSSATLNYLLLGDSIAAGAGVVNPDEACYGRIVANTNGYNYTNRAISGSPSEGLLAQLKLTDVKNDVKNANIISISIGGNDFLESNWISLFASAMFTNYRMFDTVAAKFSQNFAKIIETIRSLNPRAKILVQTVYNPRSGLFEGFVQQGVDRLNDVYRSYLREHPGSYTIVEVGAALTGHADYFSMDGIHPNANGNIVIARVILSALKALGLGTKTQPVIATLGVDSDGFIRKILKLLGVFWN